MSLLRRVLVGLGVVLFVGFAAARIYLAIPATPYLPLDDPDAGPVRITASACFLAKVNKAATQCTEPKVIAGSAQSYLARAHYFMEMEEHERARVDVDAALAIDRASASAHHLAGRLAYTLFDIERADREIVVARKLRPDDPRIETSYAIVLMGRRANVEALSILSEVVRRHPEYLYARWQRAQLYSHIGDCCGGDNFRAALRDLDVLIRRTTVNVALLESRAHVLVALNRGEAAASDLTAALELAPHHSQLLKDRAHAYVLAGMYSDAVRDLDTVLDTQAEAPIYPMFENDRAKLLMDRAKAFVELHRYDQAVRDAIAAVSIGGKPAVLRTQVMLRRHGFPDVPLDGQVSEPLRQALAACFGLKSCYYELRSI